MHRLPHRPTVPAIHRLGQIVVVVANVALVAITLRRMTLLSLRPKLSGSAQPPFKGGGD